MKPYHILKSFKGSQNGIDSHEFIAGTIAKLSDDLAKAALAEGWVESPFTEVAGVEQPLPIGDPKEALTLAEDRETKVEAPAETKPSKKKR